LRGSLAKSCLDLQQWLSELIDEFDKDLMVLGAIRANWQWLDFLRCAEVVMVGTENPVPLHAMATGHAQASNALMNACDEYNRNQESRLKQQKERSNLGNDVSMPFMPKTQPTPRI